MQLPVGCDPEVAAVDVAAAAVVAAGDTSPCAGVVAAAVAALAADGGETGPAPCWDSGVPAAGVDPHSLLGKRCDCRGCAYRQ